jgi:HAD superfamily hydrolase (TIGR01549 family)
VSQREKQSSFDTAVLDIDGTLVDSTYAHVWSWCEALRVCGVDVATWRVHRAIGMGGDKLVAAVAGAEVEDALGDELRDHQSEAYQRLRGNVTSTHGARGLLAALKERGLRVALASSGSRDDTEHAVELLDAGPLLDATISGDDAEATKPDTEPVRRAVDVVDGTRALVVGDSVWDMRSARKAGHVSVGLLCGGISEAELLDAGARSVYDDPAALTCALDELLHQHDHVR